MKTPCELVVTTLLPTIRASIAVELVKRHGMKQKEAARLLGLTTAAVSQYLSMKRATKRELYPFRSEKFKELVKEAADVIASQPGEVEAMRALCRCCTEVRRERLLCEVHREIAPGLRDCDHCLDLCSI